MADVTDIPSGFYCYTVLSVDAKTGRMKTKVCPFWSRSDAHDEQENGHCSFMDKGDWQDGGLSLLWDMVKECNIP